MNPTPYAAWTVTKAQSTRPASKGVPAIRKAPIAMRPKYIASTASIGNRSRLTSTRDGIELLVVVDEDQRRRSSREQRLAPGDRGVGQPRQIGLTER